MKWSSNRNGLGFTLIEALVALVVLAVGVLGLASMQIKALQGAHLSYQRSVATMAAQDMEEMLWVQLGMQGVGSDSLACPSAADDVLIKNPNFDPTDASTTNDEPTTVLPITDNTIFDVWYGQWVKVLPTLEKNASTAVKIETNIPNYSSCIYTITVSWGDERFSAETDVSEFVYRTSIIDGSL
ncbi:type IV pilus modification protein PilV [Halomonas aquatica]|uniref:Type IV pilus modification protein PilV n=1 Tax=Halomonas aquatica TaxID=3151123 RepID=A0ABV1NI84_9GAMM